MLFVSPRCVILVLPTDFINGFSALSAQVRGDRSVEIKSYPDILLFWGDRPLTSKNSLTRYHYSDSLPASLAASISSHVTVRVRLCACMRACVRACVRVCVCVVTRPPLPSTQPFCVSTCRSVCLSVPLSKSLLALWNALALTNCLNLYIYVHNNVPTGKTDEQNLFNGTQNSTS